MDYGRLEDAKKEFLHVKQLEREGSERYVRTKDALRRMEIQ